MYDKLMDALKDEMQKMAGEDGVEVGENFAQMLEAFECLATEGADIESDHKATVYNSALRHALQAMISMID